MILDLELIVRDILRMISLASYIQEWKQYIWDIRCFPRTQNSTWNLEKWVLGQETKVKEAFKRYSTCICYEVSLFEIFCTQLFSLTPSPCQFLVPRVTQVPFYFERGQSSFESCIFLSSTFLIHHLCFSSKYFYLILFLLKPLIDYHTSSRFGVMQRRTILCSARTF
jgi:hypothetical protein